MGVSPKTVEAWESGRNKPEGASRRLLEVVQNDPGFLKRFQAEPVTRLKMRYAGDPNNSDRLTPR